MKVEDLMKWLTQQVKRLGELKYTESPIKIKRKNKK